jgi:hypothetical protein
MTFSVVARSDDGRAWGRRRGVLEKLREATPQIAVE